MNEPMRYREHDYLHISEKFSIPIKISMRIYSGNIIIIREIYAVLQVIHSLNSLNDSEYSVNLTNYFNTDVAVHIEILRFIICF